MVIDTHPLGQDRFRYGSTYGTGIIPGIPFLGQLPEVAGGVIAAEAAGGSRPSFWRQVAVGVVTGLCIYAGHKLLDRVLG